MLCCIASPCSWNKKEYLSVSPTHLCPWIAATVCYGRNITVTGVVFSWEADAILPVLPSVHQSSLNPAKVLLGEEAVVEQDESLSHRHN